MVEKYSGIQRLLHWVIAVLVIGALIGGQILDIYGFNGLVESFGQDVTNLIYKYHKTAGVMILALMVLRIAAKIVYGAPEYRPTLSRAQRIGSHSAHMLLYLALVAMPLLGWAATAAGGFPVEFFNWKLPGVLSKDPALAELLFELHGAVGKLIFALVVVHIVAALAHHFYFRDQVLQRML